MSGAPFRLAGDKIAAFGDRIALASMGGSAGQGGLPSQASRARDGSGASEVTYAELAARAAAVWRALLRGGAAPGDPVALVSGGRGHDEAIGLVGILTSGCVAIPLDATAPPQRLASIMRARGCSALVHDAQAAGLAEAVIAELARDGAGDAIRVKRVVLDAQGVVQQSDVESAGAAPTAPSIRAARRAIGPVGSIACVLHTSGSTGTPKPVPIAWSGLDAFTRWMIDLIGLAPGDRVLRVAELIFDLAWFDHIATLRAGATLVSMSRRELAAGAALRDAIRGLAPTVIYGVPSLFMKLVAALPAGEPIPARARALLFAGEVFPPRELKSFAERAPEAILYNLYGPTETNVCTYHKVDRAKLDGSIELPIGIACPYATCRLIEEGSAANAREIEGAGTGELFVSGPTTVGGGPYATRDRVERGADGLFYFRGRIDRMVKIRGYRVEPGEVEAALGAHPAARQAAVVVHDDPRLGKTLRAYVELRPGEQDPGDRALRMFLAERLPPYMVPDKVVIMGELPRTSTGKIDYRSLEAPAPSAK